MSRDDAPVLDLEVPGCCSGSEGRDSRHGSIKAAGDCRRAGSRGNLQQGLLRGGSERGSPGREVRLEGVGAKQPQHHVEREHKEGSEQQDRQQPHEQIGNGQFPADRVQEPLEQVAPEVHEHRPQGDDEDHPGVGRPGAGQGACRGQGGDNSDSKQKPARPRAGKSLRRAFQTLYEGSGVSGRRRRRNGRGGRSGRLPRWLRWVLGGDVRVCGCCWDGSWPDCRIRGVPRKVRFGTFGSYARFTLETRGLGAARGADDPSKRNAAPRYRVWRRF